MTPIISILVPIYNVEPYLQRCIDSVLAQDFQDWEMILVDDGSPDRCPEICDEAARKDERIMVVHKENGGLVSARREGVRNARGEYLMFLDSDDWLEPQALSVLYTYMAENYDMVMGCAKRVTDRGDVMPFDSYLFEEGIINSAEEFLIKTYIGQATPHLWGALYRASLFDDSIFNESIDNRISLGEDMVTKLIVGMRFKKVLFVKDVVYNYFFNSSSIMATKRVSPEYGARLESFLHDRVFVHFPVLTEWQQAKCASYCFTNCFIPELGFSNEYDHYRTFLKDQSLREKIKVCTCPRFLIFVEHKHLYQIYSALYRWLFKLLRQNRQNKQALD